MSKQQISPWTIYDKNESKTQESGTIVKNKIRHELSPKNQNKRQVNEKYLRINDLLTQMSIERAKLHQKINFLATLNLVKEQLSLQFNNSNQIRILLPPLKNQNNIFDIDQVKKPRRRRHYFSQKLSVANQLKQQALQDFSKIFISKSLPQHPQEHAKPQFPKISRRNKNKSVLLPQLNRKQFDDKSILQTLQLAKQINYYKKSSNLKSSQIYQLQV